MLILKLLIDPHTLIFEGNPFHSFAMQYWNDLCPIALVKGDGFILSDCLVKHVDTIRLTSAKIKEPK